MGYRGVSIPIPVGTRGFNGSRNQTILGPAELSQAKSVRFKDNTIRTAPGFVTVDANGVSNANASCIAGISYDVDVDTARTITVWDDGNIFKEVSADIDSVTLASGLGYSAPISLVKAGQENGYGDAKLFIFGADETPKVVTGDGATASNLSSVPADWATANPAFAVFHDYRLWAFAPSAFPHMCYASRLDDHGAFTAATDELDPPLFSIMPGIGSKISAAIPDPQLNSRTMYVFKYPQGVYSFDSSDVVSRFIPINTISTAVGCAGHNAVAEVEGDIWFIGSDGHIYSLSSIGTQQNVKRADISAALNLTDYIKTNVSLTYSNLRHTILKYDPDRKEVWVLYRNDSNGLNDKGFVIDVSDINNPKVSTEERFEVGALWMDKANNLYMGGASNQVGLQDIDDFELLGSAFTSVAEFSETDFSWVNQAFGQINKRFDWLEIEVLRQPQETDMTITFSIDGSTYRSETVTIPVSGSPFGTTFDAPFILGGGTKPNRIKIPIGGYGRRLGVKFTVSTLDKSFELARMTIGIKPIGNPGEIN